MDYIFDRHLYREGMRQTKSIGFLMFALCLVSTVAMPVYYLYAASRDANLQISYISNTGFAGGLRFFAFLLPFVFLAKLFDFLFKRGASDFYHALPYKRQCIYFTNLIVAVTWYAVSIIVPLFIAAILLQINSRIRFSWAYLGNNIIVYMVLVLFLSGAYLIGASIVGKRGVATEVGLFVAFLPRLLMFVSVVTVSNMVPLIDNNYVGYFSTKYNLAMELSIGALTDYAGYTTSFTFVPGILITLLEAIVYIGIGMVLFTKRRSEVAENAAPNFKALIAIQVFLTMIIFIFGVSQALCDDEIGEFIAMAVFGTIAYFVYSCFILKKFKIAVKTLIGIPVLLVISFVYYEMIITINSSVISNIPSADSIKSITILDKDTSFLTGWMGDKKTYNDLLLEHIAFEDEKLNNLIVKNYDYTCTRISEKKLDPYENHELIRINYKNGSSKVRNIYIDSSIKEKFGDILSAKKEYIDAVCAIPEKCEPDCFSHAEYNKQLWESYKEEYGKLSDREKYEIYVFTKGFSSGMGMEEVAPDDMYEVEREEFGARGMYEGTEYYNTYIIFKDLMPKTYDLYRELEYLDRIKTFNKAVSAVNEKSFKYGYVGLNIIFGFEEPVMYDGYVIEWIDMNFDIDEHSVSYANICLSLSQMEDVPEEEMAEKGEYYEKARLSLDINLSEDQAYEFFNGLIDCFEFDHKMAEGRPSGRITINYYDGSSNMSDRFASIGLNCNVQKVKELIDNAKKIKQ